MKKVMLVEDDQSILSLLSTLMQFEGYQPIQPDCSDKDNLIQCLIATKPDVLIMDVYLPHINGLEVVKAIRKEKELSDLKIIMTSGMDLCEECIKSGANVFIMKPFMPDELTDSLRSICGEEK